MSTTPPERDWDAEFTQITAQLQDEQPPVPGFRDQWRIPSTPEPPPEPVGQSPQVPDVDDTPDEGDDFVPPTPQPLPADDPATTIMIASFVVGPLWLAYLGLFARDAQALWWAMAGAVCTLGLVLAVARQPRTRDEDDPDDGARV